MIRERASTLRHTDIACLVCFLVFQSTAVPKSKLIGYNLLGYAEYVRVRLCRKGKYMLKT
jgi:hypothetical protein